MGKLPEQRDLPPWAEAPEDLNELEVFQVEMRLLEAVFGPDGSHIAFVEQVKALAPLDLAEGMVYGSYLYKFRTKWRFQSAARRHRQRQGQLGSLVSRCCAQARVGSFSPSSAALLTAP